MIYNTITHKLTNRNPVYRVKDLKLGQIGKVETGAYVMRTGSSSIVFLNDGSVGGIDQCGELELKYIFMKGDVLTFTIDE
jgi:hypothetical protein